MSEGVDVPHQHGCVDMTNLGAFYLGFLGLAYSAYYEQNIETPHPFPTRHV